jgi:TatD DNase family protein
MIDTHCHLDVARFDDDRDAVLSRAWSAGLTGLVIPAIGPDSWEALLRWPSREPRVQVALGIHPQLVPALDPADDDRHLATLDELLGRGIAIAVGECGLDGPSEVGAPMERQVRLFRAHIALARKHRLPLVVHCLRAHPHLQRVLAEEPPITDGILLHSYSGSGELAPRYAKHGCHFSFAGPVSFQEARRPLDALRAVPADRLMAETDAPDQAPHPLRGTRNEPGHLPLIIDAMAVARGVSSAELRVLTTRNALAFFSRTTFS